MSSVKSQPIPSRPSSITEFDRILSGDNKNTFQDPKKFDMPRFTVQGEYNANKKSHAEYDAQNCVGYGAYTLKMRFSKWVAIAKLADDKKNEFLANGQASKDTFKDLDAAYSALWWSRVWKYKTADRTLKETIDERVGQIKKWINAFNKITRDSRMDWKNFERDNLKNVA